MFVKIRIRGRLRQEWSDWLEGLDVSPQANGETVLKGSLTDQTALLGLLNRIHGLNLQLIALTISEHAPANHR
ncbi:MAG: hypothetical protein IPM16_02110 [Chloroflexi bacterium]|nr:hypothetical protein [Chloroflexota bacterium]